MSPREVLFWQKCIRTLDRFVADKEDSSLEIAEAHPKQGERPLLKNQEEDRPHGNP